MRVSGFAALAFAVLSLLCWLVSWMYWNLLMGPNSFGSALHKLMQGIGFLGSFLEYLAILAAAAGLIVGHKAHQQNTSP